MNKLRKHIKGDTIIEVLLAIVVVSGTLGTAFATMNSGALGTRAAHERAEALKFVETQIELLRAAADNDSPNIYSRGDVSNFDPFCLSQVAGTIQIHNVYSPSAPIGDVQTDAFPYEAPCSQGVITDGYNVSIVEGNPVDGTDNVFTIRARWENINGDNRDQLEIKYKMEP